MNSGVKQWIFQRVSNALIISFGLCLLCELLYADSITYASLTELFSGQVFKIYLAVVLIFSCLNSVLAGWQIDGDYAKKFGMPQNVLTVTAAIVSLLFLFFGLSLIF